MLLKDNALAFRKLTLLKVNTFKVSKMFSVINAVNNIKFMKK
jgi:hypothetical protein